MRINKLTKIALFAIIVFMIALLSFLPGWYKKQPKLNPHPKYFITIHGHAAPEYQGKLKIVIQQEFDAWNDKCGYYKAFLSPLTHNEKKVIYSIKLTNTGSYSVRVPTDLYKSGYCKWKPMGINLAVKNHNFSQDIVYYDNTSHTPSINSINISCMQNNKTCSISDKFYYELPIQVALNRSRTIEINFLNKGKKHD